MSCHPFSEVFESLSPPLEMTLASKSHTSIDVTPLGIATSLWYKVLMSLFIHHLMTGGREAS